MPKMKMYSIIAAAFLLIPSLAMATHITSLTPGADCEGWGVEMVVQWRTGVYEGDLDYVIQLQDLDGNVLEEVTWAGMISRGMDDPSIQTYAFSGDWEGMFEAPSYNVWGSFHLVAPFDGGVDEDTMDFTVEMDCTVATEGETWSTVKSLYR